MTISRIIYHAVMQPGNNQTSGLPSRGATLTEPDQKRRNTGGPSGRRQTERPLHGRIAVRLLWVAGLSIFWSTPDIAAGQGPTRVEVAPVRHEAVAPTTWLVGTVRPRVRTVVASEVAGLVAAMQVDDGVAVSKGQVLCKLRDVRTRLAHAEALARLREYEGAFAEQTAELKKSQFEKSRTERLWTAQQCSEKEYQDAQAEYEAALSRVDQARSRAESQKALADGLGDDLACTEIVAPCDGYVVSRRTEIGSWVALGGPVVELVDASTARVRVPVPEDAVRYCELGAMATVAVEAMKKSYSGRIARIIPDADERARTFPIEIDIANPAGKLKPGMFVRAAVPTGPKAEHLIVPKDAIVPRGPVSMIFVVREGREGPMAMPMPVSLIAEVEDRAAVSAPMLQDGDQVVVRGNEYMFAPGPVIVVPGSTAAPAEEAGVAEPSTASQSAGLTTQTASRPAEANKPVGNQAEAAH